MLSKCPGNPDWRPQDKSGRLRGVGPRATRCLSSGFLFSGRCALFNPASRVGRNNDSIGSFPLHPSWVGWHLCLRKCQSTSHFPQATAVLPGIQTAGEQSATQGRRLSRSRRRSPEGEDPAKATPRPPAQRCARSRGPASQPAR